VSAAGSLSPHERAALSLAQAKIIDLREALVALGVKSRELSIVLTKLDEARMWIDAVGR